MFKPTLILLTSLLITFSSFSQPFKKKPCFSYTVDESKIEFTIPAEYNQNHIFVDEIKLNPQIEDVLVQTNYCTKLLPLHFEEGLAKSFKMMYNANIETGMRAMDVYVRDLNIRTNYLLEEKHQVMELALDYFMRENGKSQKVFSTHHATEMNDKGHVEEALSSLLRLSTIEFLAFEASNKLFPSKENLVEINTNEAVLQRGIYTSFKDLKNNQPSLELDANISATIDNNKEQYVLTCPETGKTLKHSYLFGFSDGESIYLNTAKYYKGNHFIKLNPFAGNFMLSEDVVVDEQKLTAYYHSSEVPSDMTFGAISVIFDESLSTKKNKLIINMNDGSMVVLTNKNFKRLIKKDKELLRLYHDVEQKNEACQLKFIKELAKRGKKSFCSTSFHKKDTATIGASLETVVLRNFVQHYMHQLC